jgi:predicted dehydrogenase
MARTLKAGASTLCKLHTRKREKPFITGLDGLKALKIAEAALKSSKTGKLVRLK